MSSRERLADLKKAMELIAEAVEQLPDSCRDLAGNALLNIAAEAVAEDVGCAEAGRIFSRLGDLLGQGERPPMSKAVSLSGFDA
jgi:predicted Zn-dependent protease with MMP-like domain